MKHVGWVSSMLVGGIALAVGCADDDRPVTGIVENTGGDAARGGEPSANGGSKPNGGANAQGGSAGTAGKAGSAAVGGAAGEAGSGNGGAAGSETPPGDGGVAGQGGGGADDFGGAGGAAPGDAAPFAGPYAVVFAAPKVGVDIRFPAEVAFSNGALVHWKSGVSETRDIGTALNLNVGQEGVVQWGRWTDGTITADTTFALNAKQGLHYAIGAESAGLPANGTQEYVLTASTPVTVGDGSEDVGEVSASSVTAAFGATTKVGASFSLKIGTASYVVTTTGGTATPATSEVTTFSASHPGAVAGANLQEAGGICGDGCTSSVMGFFAGQNAENLAIVIHLFDGAGGTPTSVSGVLVFKKKP